VEAHVGASGVKGKGKKKADDDEGVVEGIVYRVSLPRRRLRVHQELTVEIGLF
jgi:hypothetical protein